MAFQLSKEKKGYHILDDQGVIDIHNATMELMESYGVRIFGQEAKEIYEAAGCDVDYETTGTGLQGSL